ncbi:MAG: arginyltransferase [Candidatus Muproteobacteria bacterium RBG_19FT_COMBO_61_10]|uniref:Aspartate/glutamate leucyltransferase n=1 Tax=Candidatus Muproteobacteria bacterium RBG_19FT_COMBO_61_10 TaxID=1817761 RepID=A0A1F6UK65_9PROT|nr:MAG: arginyltransferase [Candidatus Muproteobacteria bacterium RBG_19FT_COMBO_61_10]
MTIRQNKPDLYLSMPHSCSYLDGRMSTILFVDPQRILNEGEYGAFVRQGFRRSGDLVYRPHCQGCRACVAVRVPVREFTPARGQRRVWRRNRDIEIVEKPAQFDPAHFDLYRRYQAGRHPDSGMNDADPQKYLGFLTSRQVETKFFELRAQNRLLGVAVTDVLPDGLSAVYTFYEPELPQRGLGVYAVLWEIAETARRGLDYLYLGYWIAESPKMSYKINYQPAEVLQDGHWTRLAPTR